MEENQFERIKNWYLEVQGNDLILADIEFGTYFHLLNPHGYKYVASVHVIRDTDTSHNSIKSWIEYKGEGRGDTLEEAICAAMDQWDSIAYTTTWDKFEPQY